MFKGLEHIAWLHHRAPSLAPPFPLHTAQAKGSVSGADQDAARAVDGLVAGFEVRAKALRQAFAEGKADAGSALEELLGKAAGENRGQGGAGFLLGGGSGWQGTARREGGGGALLPRRATAGRYEA